jgi:GT2 family glycosyltransferase
MNQPAAKSSRPPGEAQVPQYDAVVLYFRRGPEVRVTVESLLAQTAPPRRVLVFDNGSRDGVVEDSFLDPRVTVHVSHENLGYAGGMNAAAELLGASSRWLLFLTHEVLLEERCAALLLKAAGDAKAAVVGPTLVLPSGRVWSSGGEVGARGNAFHRESGGDAEIVESPWVDGAVMLVDARVFRAAEGFDESLYLYWEDVEFCLRASAWGAVVVAASARAQQDTSTTPVYFGTRNRLLVWRRRRERIRFVVSVLESVARVVRDVLRRDWAQASARSRGLWDGLLGRPARLIMVREAR